MSGDVLSSPEAAKVLGVSGTTISRLVKHGRLTPVRVIPTTGARFFDREDVETVIDRIRSGHGPECPYGVEPFTRGWQECQCRSCHCATHVPGGEFGVCQTCLRPLVVDGRVVRRAPLEESA